MQIKQSYLPEKGTPEAEKLTNLYQTASRVELLKVATQYGYKNYDSFTGAMRKTLGVSAPKTRPTVEVQETDKLYVPYPALTLTPIPVIKERDPEVLNIMRADAHVAKKTESYDLATYARRVEYLTAKVLLIATLHKPIQQINVYYLGDQNQGENGHQGSKIGDTECGAYDQVHTYAVPTESRFLNSLAQIANVKVYAVPGNHGVYSKEATKRTNWDNFFYKALMDANINQKRLTVTMPTKFYELVNVLGFKIFIFHGDQVRATSGIPLFALKRKLQEWYAYVNGFHYAYGGHFHTWGADTVNSMADYQLCPPLVTGDEWALEVVGRASKPIQLCFGIHPRYGRTWEYQLYTDDSCLPKPMGELNG